MAKEKAGIITINEKDVDKFFQLIKDNYSALGMWQSQGTTDRADDYFVLPNGLEIDKELGHRWITFNESV